MSSTQTVLVCNKQLCVSYGGRVYFYSFYASPDLILADFKSILWKSCPVIADDQQKHNKSSWLLRFEQLNLVRCNESDSKLVKKKDGLVHFWNWRIIVTGSTKLFFSFIVTFAGACGKPARSKMGKLPIWPAKDLTQGTFLEVQLNQVPKRKRFIHGNKIEAHKERADAKEKVERSGFSLYVHIYMYANPLPYLSIRA